MDLVTRQSQNNRKIPEAVFIENVDEYISKYTVQKVMECLQEAYNKYKFMEASLTKQRDTMNGKIPEITKAIQIVEYLGSPHEEDIKMDFLLTDTIWAKASVEKEQKTVCLWLGANTMVEFYYHEAKGLLNSNLENAISNLKSFVINNLTIHIKQEEDLNYLKDQITTIEVDIARIYNANIKITQQQAQLKQGK